MTIETSNIEASGSSESVKSVSDLKNWIERFSRDTENHIKQDFHDQLNTNGAQKGVPRHVTDYFNDLQNKETDPLQLERINKFRDFTEKLYLNEDRFVAHFVNSKSKSIEIKFALEAISTSMKKVNQILSSN